MIPTLRRQLLSTIPTCDIATAAAVVDDFSGITTAAAVDDSNIAAIVDKILGSLELYARCGFYLSYLEVVGERWGSVPRVND